MDINKGRVPEQNSDPDKTDEGECYMSESSGDRSTRHVMPYEECTAKMWKGKENNKQEHYYVQAKDIFFFLRANHFISCFCV